jgi:hypothetical protein
LLTRDASVAEAVRARSECFPGSRPRQPANRKSKGKERCSKRN